MDRNTVKVISGMKDLLIRLSVDDRVFQFTYIMVVDIPEAYGLILSRDWYTKLNGTLQMIGPTCGLHIKIVKTRLRY